MLSLLFVDVVVVIVAVVAAVVVLAGSCCCLLPSAQCHTYMKPLFPKGCYSTYIIRVSLGNDLYDAGVKGNFGIREYLYEDILYLVLRITFIRTPVGKCASNST